MRQQKVITLCGIPGQETARLFVSWRFQLWFWLYQLCSSGGLRPPPWESHSNAVVEANGWKTPGQVQVRPTSHLEKMYIKCCVVQCKIRLQKKRKKSGSIDILPEGREKIHVSQIRRREDVEE